MKVVLFDLDGTLVDSIEVVLSSFRHTFAEFDHQYPGDDKIAPLIGSNIEAIFAKFFPEDVFMQSLVDVYRTDYLQKQNRGAVQLFGDVVGVLNELRGNDYLLGVVTTKLRMFSEKLLGELGVLELFDVIIGAEDVQNCKPDPEPLILAASKLNTNIFNCVYVGDSVHDANAAANAGMPFFGVLTGTGKDADLKPFGQVFPNLETLKKQLLVA